jgi:short-subunit dehydrogenase
MTVFETNFFGVVRMTQAVLPAMRQQVAGRIVNIGSVAGFVPMPFQAAYAATKHALAGWTESLDLEESREGCRSRCAGIDEKESEQKGARRARHSTSTRPSYVSAERLVRAWSAPATRLDQQIGTLNWGFLHRRSQRGRATTTTKRRPGVSA